MLSTFFPILLAFYVSAVSALAIVKDELAERGISSLPQKRASCVNSATDRSCWGDYDITTDWVATIFSTNVTREYWLSVENITLAPDGYSRYTMSFNGTIPGPAIIADWGDNIIIHVTNNLQHNGTAIHFHGLTQLDNSEYDGVPGVTQCPIAPGDEFTYKFPATQYGTTWYHSHFSLQYADGLYGPIIINGPASANYDTDLGTVMLTDWGHESAFALYDIAKIGAPPTLENTLINGTNTYDCTDSTDANCLGTGSYFETTFEAGQSYRMRFINSGTDAHFRLSIDNHNFTVIAMDLVPIVPFDTDNLLIAIGQRYDIVVTATETSGDYWLRAGWQSACSTNGNPDNALGIIRYDSTSTADPTSTQQMTVAMLASSCQDQDLSDLVPYLSTTIETATNTDQELDLDYVTTTSIMWTINTSTLLLNWSDPTILQIYNNVSQFPTDYNVVALTGVNEWVYFIIQDNSGLGISHPIHLHGHDFWIIGQSLDTYDASTAVFNLDNPPRRDTATLPGGGYLAMAFLTDNPGSWLCHCHIAWHASEGLSLQFVERESEIAATFADVAAFEDTCSVWDAYVPTEVYMQDDSGI